MIGQPEERKVEPPKKKNQALITELSFINETSGIKPLFDQAMIFECE
jgi:hypothetical protein